MLLRTLEQRVDFCRLLVVVIIFVVPCTNQRSGAAAQGSKMPLPGSASGKGSGHGSDFDSYDYDGGRSYQYSEVLSYDDTKPVDNSILCYTCEYEVTQTLEKTSHVEGEENCKDPFHSFDIPMIKCHVNCSIKYQKVDEVSYNFRRGCLKNCLERSDVNGYTKCCMTKLCNGYSASYALKDLRWLLLLSCICTIIVGRL